MRQRELSRSDAPITPTVASLVVAGGLFLLVLTVPQFPQRWALSGRESTVAPMLIANEVLTLTNFGHATRAISGSLYNPEPDGIWIAPGNSTIHFRLNEEFEDAHLRLNLTTYEGSGHTRLTLTTEEDTTERSFEVPGDGGWVEVQLSRSQSQTVRIRCEADYTQEERGPDVRELCAKLFALLIVTS